MLSFHPKSLFKSQDKNDEILEKSNIICFQVDHILKQTCDESYVESQLRKCSACSSVILNNDCVICSVSSHNKLPYQSLVEYKQNQKFTFSIPQTHIPVIVFCIDISGSMNGTRLDMVRTACLATVDQLNSQNAKMKVALITFDDCAYYYGDKSSVTRTVQTALPTGMIKKKVENLREISQSYSEVRNALVSLQSKGGTQICAALCESLSIGDEIVLCTDGEASDANIQYYDELIEFAKINKIKINVISFDDANCRLAVLGKFANETGGIIGRTDSSVNLTKSIGGISTKLLNTSLAPNLSFKLLFNKHNVIINNSSQTIEEQNVDKYEKIIYDLNVTNSSLNEVIIQLQIQDVSRLCVLTVKRDVVKVSKDFINATGTFNVDVLHAKVLSEVKKMVGKESKDLSIVQTTTTIYSNLYKLLNIQNLPREIENVFQVLKKNEQVKDSRSLNDQDAFTIYNALDMFKANQTFKPHVREEVKLSFEENAGLIQASYENLSSILNTNLTHDQSNHTNDEKLEKISCLILDATKKAKESSALSLKLKLLGEVTKVSKIILSKVNIFQNSLQSVEKIIDTKIHDLQQSVLFNQAPLKQENNQMINSNFKSNFDTPQYLKQLQQQLLVQTMQPKQRIYQKEKSIPSGKEIYDCKGISQTPFKAKEEKPKTTNISVEMNEISSLIENIKLIGLINNCDEVAENFSNLNDLIEEERKMSKQKYLIDMIGIITFLSKVTNKTMKIKNEAKAKNTYNSENDSLKDTVELKIQEKYYNKIAGQNDIGINEVNKSKISRDCYGNLAGTEYDLCPNFAFNGETIAVLQFYNFDFSFAKSALEQKGFSLHIWTNTPAILEFEQVLNNSCQLWIISDSRIHLNSSYLDIIKKFFEKGRGVFIWGDNYPFIADANLVAMHLFNGSMSGNVSGDKCVEVQKVPKKSGFKPNHLISTGIVKLYEGVTVATIAENPDLDPLVYGSADNVVASVYDKNGKRSIIDGGFTRLFHKWDSEGTQRYVVNAAAWLVNVEKTKKELFDQNKSLFGFSRIN